MEELNRTLFLLLNAPANPGPFVLNTAIFFAEYAIWAVPAVIAIGWLRGAKFTRQFMLEATAAAAVALFINQLIALIWLHPRPFVLGLGHTFVDHAPDSSFPSDHLTLLWSVAFSLAIHRGQRATGLALALLGLPVAWARIYVGVHFPLDMAGAVVVSACGAWLAARPLHRLTRLAYRLAIRIHPLLFGRLIARGWVRP
ncbi:undecaprenyl-diphosphatase [Trinickia terrae]|uniref:Undecaprenyl-diphosphatase n=1 Tax=Trinickia terrae TaxID=2571161 RepID=A0A4U1HZH2_9BURK|nr:undecaprenyl-diphosphatase [Trinickia terrae]TKC86317.1 undecaprenyl-diphosphatase [Trinickia terrae]